MPRISTDNYDTVASWNGSQDLFVVEQPDGTKVATPAMVKQFMEAGNFTATGEIEDGHGNKLSGVVDIIGDLSQTGLTGNSVAEQLANVGDQFADFAVKTWTPKIYDYLTYKRDAAEQKYIKIGSLYVMFMEGTFDFSDISTMLIILNLPCTTCVGGTIFMGGLKTSVVNTKGNRVQGDGKGAYPRPNVISSDFDSPSSAPRNKFVFFGYD